MTQRLRRKASHPLLPDGMSLLRASLAGAAAVLLLVSSVRGAGPVEGWASEYGPGNGVAMTFCTWTLRHSEGCGWVRIQSLDTGVTVVVQVIDYCYCLVPDSPHPHRVVDLEYGVVKALGLDPSLGMYEVSVERTGTAGPLLPNTATK